jgi:hypothetical protein
MPAWAWVLIAIAILAAIGYLVYRMMATRRLRDHFQDEYDRTIDESESRRAGEAELRDRARRRKELDIVPLSEQSRARYTDRWQSAQSRFVDTPVEAVREADVLIIDVMRERGYPMEDFDRRADDISVDHPNVVTHFRSAHKTMEAGDRATTEDLREAMVHYRALFEELVGGRVPVNPTQSAGATTGTTRTTGTTSQTPPPPAGTTDEPEDPQRRVS